MKTHFLSPVASVAQSKAALEGLLPGQQDPWLLLAPSGDPIAYFNVGEELDGAPLLHVSADVSGRHYNEDAAVKVVLLQLREMVGGDLSIEP
jgi:hypothetical protein